MKKVIIIEDEPAAYQELKILIEKKTNFKFSGYAGTLDEAILLIQKENPDLVFMDINLYDCNAFDILNKLEQLPPHIIFVTAYNQYAIKAIKYGALDYLLKPIDEEEFMDAIARFEAQHISEKQVKDQLSLTETHLQAPDTPKHIALPALGELRIVQLSDIRYCQGDGPYTHFFLVSGKKETVSKPLKYYESILPEAHFIRTHQSYIVHLPYVKSIVKHAFIRMDNAVEIPISSRRRNDILPKLKL